MMRVRVFARYLALTTLMKSSIGTWPLHSYKARVILITTHDHLDSPMQTSPSPSLLSAFRVPTQEGRIKHLLRSSNSIWGGGGDCASFALGFEFYGSGMGRAWLEAHQRLKGLSNLWGFELKLQASGLIEGESRMGFGLSCF